MKAIALLMVLCAARFAVAELTVNPQGGFTSIQTATLAGTPEQMFDAMTGDILPWWDHHFSEQPHKLYIEPRAGGRFMEEFDDQGNGALHATVILCKRPEIIRFDGPLGLSGRALNHVVTYEFKAQGDSTVITLTAQMSGSIDQEWATTVDGVWRHFLIEAFKPYIEKRE